MLVVTEISAKSGLGNFRRSSTICNELSRTVDVNLLVISDAISLKENIVSETFPMQVMESIESFSFSDARYSHMLIDVGTLDLNYFVLSAKKINPKIKVVALDYFLDSSNLDLRISIFNQDSKLFTSTDKKHLVGMQYAVIDDLPEISTQKHSLPTVAVRFSGDNPDFLGKVKTILETLNSPNSINIRYLNNSDLGKLKRQIVPRLDYLELISNSNLVICSGVTTLFECSILKVPTIFVGSNKLERNFGFELSRNNKIVTIDGFSINFEHELKSILTKVDYNGPNEFLVPNLELDFKGKNRVVEAILSI